MSFIQFLLNLTIGGLAGIGASFMVATFVKAGIKKAVEHNFDRKLEDIKSALKKSEVYFTVQLEALSNLRRIHRRILPKQRHPGADWTEACEDIAKEFSKHHHALDEFLCRYGAVLPQAVESNINDALMYTSDGQFEWTHNDGRLAPTNQAIKLAGQLYHSVEEAVEQFQVVVNEQAGKPKRSSNYMLGRQSDCHGSALS